MVSKWYGIFCISKLLHIVDLITLSGGHRVAPIEIDDCIKSEVEFLSNVVLIGDNRKYLTCLVTLKVKTFLTNKILVVFS